MEINKRLVLFFAIYTTSFLCAQEVEIEQEGYTQQGMEEETITPGQLLKQAEEHEKAGNHQKAIEHYLELSIRNPNNSDYLYKLGRLYSLSGDDENAERYYLSCLAVKPEYSDARVGLAYVYSRQGKTEEAKEQFEIVVEHNPKNIDALLGLARIYSKQGNTTKSDRYYSEVFKIDPNHPEGMVIRAKSNLRNYQFRDAFKKYQKMYNNTKGGVDKYYNELAYLRPYVYPQVRGYGSYSKEEEEDLVTKVLTTRINSVYSFGELMVPITDNLRAFTLFGNAPTRQINLLSETNNYNMQSPFCSLGLEAYYRAVSFEGKMRVKWGLDKKSTPTNIFPFRYTRLWEPSFKFKYLGDNHVVILNAYRDSFIARNFSTINFSYFVKRTEIVPVYEYRFNYPYTALGVKGLMGWYRGVFGNKKKEVEYWFRTQIPILPESAARILAIYRGNYSTYQHVDPDYFSYRRRWVQRGKLTLLKSWGAKGSVEFSYTYLWERDVDFVNVGEAINPSDPTAPEQLNKNIFMANIFEFLAKMMVKTSLEMEASVKWYKNTNNYKTFSVTGGGRYVF